MAYTTTAKMTRAVLHKTSPIFVRTARRSTECSTPTNLHHYSTSTTSNRHAFQFLSTKQKRGSAEDDLFKQQVEEVREWWKTSRFAGLKRPYSAEDVVSKRGTLQQSYPSSTMARKLFNILEEKASKSLPLHTSECHPLKSSHSCQKSKLRSSFP